MAACSCQLSSLLLVDFTPSLSLPSSSLLALPLPLRSLPFYLPLSLLLSTLSPSPTVLTLRSHPYLLSSLCPNSPRPLSPLPCLPPHRRIMWTDGQPSDLQPLMALKGMRKADQQVGFTPLIPHSQSTPLTIYPTHHIPHSPYTPLTIYPTHTPLTIYPTHPFCSCPSLASPLVSVCSSYLPSHSPYRGTFSSSFSSSISLTYSTFSLPLSALTALRGVWKAEQHGTILPIALVLTLLAVTVPLITLSLAIALFALFLLPINAAWLAVAKGTATA